MRPKASSLLLILLTVFACECVCGCYITPYHIRILFEISCSLTKHHLKHVETYLMLHFRVVAKDEMDNMLKHPNLRKVCSRLYMQPMSCTASCVQQHHYLFFGTAQQWFVCVMKCKDAATIIDIAW